jgi:translation elongation factor EF-Tu-like GTPase
MAEMTLDDAAAAAADAKPNVRVVVCGHVDSGKSTLNGHLVYQLGRITEQEMRRATKSAAGPRCFSCCIRAMVLCPVQVLQTPARKASHLRISWTAGKRNGGAVCLLI